MEHKERYFHECPECGLLTPWVQRKCDCGYQFRQRAPADRSVSVPVFVLSLLLALAVGLIVSGWYGTRPASDVAADAPAASAAPAPSAAAEWSSKNIGPMPGSPTKTVESDGLPVLVGP